MSSAIIDVLLRLPMTLLAMYGADRLGMPFLASFVLVLICGVAYTVSYKVENEGEVE